MCEEIRKALIKNNCLNDYYVVEIKEKYGGLCWYDYGAPDEVREIIKKYCRLSYHICESCGEYVEEVHSNIFITLCDKCLKKFKKWRYK